MERVTFEERFRQATSACRAFAGKYLEETLPPALRFRLCLNASYDGNPLHPDERTYPEDDGRRLNNCSAEEVVGQLWRDGRVPEWINVSVADESGDSTLIEVDACGRFTQNHDLLYHHREGLPPFHLLGPTLPPGWIEGQRFSIHHRKECNSPAELDRALRHAHKIWSLTLYGPAFDVAPLVDLGTLKILEFEGTDVLPPVLPRALQVLRVRFADSVSQRLGDGPVLAHLTTLALMNLGERPEGLARFIRRCPALAWLTLEAPGDLEIEGVSLPRKLEQFSLTASRVRGSLSLPGHVELLSLHLPEETAPRVGDLLRSLRSTKWVSLRRTPVDDALVDVVAAKDLIQSLDLNETGVGEAKLRELTLSQPTLQVQPRVALTGLSPVQVRAIVDGALRWQRTPQKARRVDPELTFVTPWEDEPAREMWLVFLYDDGRGGFFDPANQTWVRARRNEAGQWKSESVANRIDA